MKNLFLTLLTATVFFTSCSSNDDIVNDSNDNTNTTKSAVTFNIKSAGFEVDKTPLKAFTGEENYPFWNFQVVVYKQSGEVYSDSVMLYEEFNPLVNSNGSLPFTLNLPKGNYHIAILHNPYSSINSKPKKERNVIRPNNFYKDSYASFFYTTPDLGYHNGGIYYKTFDIEVNNTSNNDIKSVVLDPMWSEVELTIKDPKLFKTPKNFKNLLLKMEILPNQYGIKIENGMAIFNQSTFRDIRNIDNEVRQSDSLNYKFTISKTNLDDTLALRVTFLFYPHNDSIAFSQTIKFNEIIENGKRYRISGKLNDVLTTKDNNQTMNISLGSFAKDDVNINF